MKKKKPTIKKLPKYYTGGPYDQDTNTSMMAENPEFFAPQDMNQQIGHYPSNAQYAGYAAVAGNAANQYNQIGQSNASQASKDQQYADTTGNALTQSAGTFSPYIAAGTGVRKSATGAVGYSAGASRTASNWMAAPHETASSDFAAAKNANGSGAQIGGYVSAIGDLTGMSKLLQTASYGTKNDEKTTGFWGGYNDAVGISARNQQKNRLNPTVPQAPNTGYYQSFAMGGETLPTQQFDGPSHEQGGIPLVVPGGAFEVEKQEAVQSMPDGSQRILSDNKSLKLPSTGKNPAQSFKPFQKIKDKIAKLREGKYIGKEAAATAKLNEATADKMYDKFYNEQEGLKQSRVQAYMKKIGYQPPQGDPNMMIARMGGTKLPKYGDGDTFYPTATGNPIPVETPFNPYLTPAEQAERATMDDFTLTGQSDSPDFRGEFPKSNTPKSGNKLDWRTPVGAGFGAGVQSIDELMYLKDQGKRYDKVDYGTVTPEKLNPREAILQAQMQARVTRNALKDQTGGNVGSYLSNLTGAQAVNSMNIANIQQTYDNQNAGIANQAKYANQGYKMQGMVDEAQNKGQALTNYYQAIGEIGNNTAGAYKDYKAGKMDMNTAKMLSSMFTNYGLDINNPNDWNIYFKKQQGDIPENPNRTKYGRSSGGYSTKQTKKD